MGLKKTRRIFFIKKMQEPTRVLRLEGILPGPAASVGDGGGVNSDVTCSALVFTTTGVPFCLLLTFNLFLF